MPKTPSHATIQTALITGTQATNARAQVVRNSFYRAFNAHYGFDIPTQSDENLAYWKNQLAQRSFDSKETCRDGLTENEWELKPLWGKGIVPQLQCHHLTAFGEDIRQDGALRSLANRRAKVENTVNAHTGKGSVNQRLVFATFGLPDQRTVSFLSPTTTPNKVVIEMQAAQEKLHGLWIGDELSNFLKERHIDGIDFAGTVRRVVYFPNRTKHRIYTRSGQAPIIITSSFQCEIFSAEHNIQDISDGLFYLFLLELFYIGDPVRSRLLNNENLAEKITLLKTLFKLFYHSSVFPEARIIDAIQLDEHVRIEETLPCPQIFIQALFNAVQTLNSITTEKILNKFPALIDIRNEDNQTLLLIAIDAFLRENPRFSVLPYVEFLVTSPLPPNQDPKEFYGAYLEQRHPNSRFLRIAHLLLARGIDITARDDQRDSALDLMIKQDKHELLPLFITAGTHYGFDIKTTALLDRPPAYDQNPLCVAVKHDALHCFHELAKQLGKLDPTLPLFPIAAGKFNNQVEPPPKSKQPAWFTILEDAGANINATDQTGKTAAMLASSADHLKWLVEHGADLDRQCEHPLPGLKDWQGNNSLHFAVTAKRDRKAIVDYVVQYAPHLCDHPNARGQFPCDLATDDEIKQLAARRIIQPRPQPIYAYTTMASIGLLIRQQDHGVDILWIRKPDRSGQPMGQWQLPGGLQNSNETAIETVAREVREETGIVTTADDWQLLTIFTDQETSQQLTFFVCTSNSLQQEPEAADDIACAQWVPMAEITAANPSTLIQTYQGIGIKPSNLLLAQTHLAKKELDEEKFYQQLLFELHAPKKLTSAFLNERDTEFYALLARGADISTSALFQKKVLPLMPPLQLNLLTSCVFKPDRFARLLQAGADVNLAQGSHTPLMLACLAGDFDRAKGLIQDHGANPFIAINDGFNAYTALSLACLHDNACDFIEFVQQKFPINPCELGSMLVTSIANEQTATAMWLLNTFIISLNQNYFFFTPQVCLHPRSTPLWVAVSALHADMVDALLARGADPFDVSRTTDLLKWITITLEHSRLSEHVHQRKSQETRPDEEAYSFVAKMEAEWAQQRESDIRLIPDAQRIQQALITKRQEIITNYAGFFSSTDNTENPRALTASAHTTPSATMSP